MKLYKVTVYITHNWTSKETHEIEVAAESEAKAISAACDEARKFDADDFSVSLKHTDIDHATAQCLGDAPVKPYRCTTTPDMFMGAPA